eukprot:m.272880 g.272880  ORF g.272880 m.272880 type:complete len:287 (+) comp40568_c0_seq12:684-1544(+)
MAKSLRLLVGKRRRNSAKPCHESVATRSWVGGRYRFPLNAARKEMHDVIVNAFPLLGDTGYEFCRGVGGGKKLIENLGKVSNVSVLKAAIGQAKCYLRPILRDLAITPQITSNNSDLLLYTCDHCQEVYEKNELRSHIEECPARTLTDEVDDQDECHEGFDIALEDRHSPVPVIDLNSCTSSPSPRRFDVNPIVVENDSPDEWTQTRREQDEAYAVGLERDEAKDREALAKRRQIERKKAIREFFDATLSQPASQGEYSSITVKARFPSSHLKTRVFDCNQRIFRI